MSPKEEALNSQRVTGTSSWQEAGWWGTRRPRLTLSGFRRLGTSNSGTGEALAEKASEMWPLPDSVTTGKASGVPLPSSLLPLPLTHTLLPNVWNAQNLTSLVQWFSTGGAQQNHSRSL